jgi:hypothetical protein
MAEQRRKILKRIKRQLVLEAGNKCANPGCSNWHSHIHHIKHWAVYKAHDSDHMIAICPSCHDSVHYAGGISDETLYAWKKIIRPERELRSHIYVEPAKDIRVLTGSMCVEAENSSGAVFKLSNANTFSFRILDGDIFISSGLLQDLSGRTIVRISENYIYADPAAGQSVARRAGKFCVTTSVRQKYLPSWLFRKNLRELPEFMIGDAMTIFDLEVVRPGVVRLQGVFVAPDAVFAITESKITILRPELDGVLNIVGAGEGTVIRATGPITPVAFQV